MSRPNPREDLDSTLSPELTRRAQADLYRRRVVMAGPQGIEPVIDGRRCLSFCSNDYLGLANHPEVVTAFQRAATEYGVGSGASHLVTGHSRAHLALEEELAHFTGRERALLFSTGYMANLGIAAALTGRGDNVYEDRLNHASLVDAALLSRARLRRYPHRDVQALEGLLGSGPQGRQLVLTDGVFSMDGDTAPVSALASVASAHGAWLMVDDAHGLGVLGDTGGGTLEAQGIDPTQVPILMGTLGKAFGTFGAFVAGSAVLIETLIQQARSYVYTTALPPAIAQATRVSLTLVQSQSWRRERLSALVRRLRDAARQLGLPLLDSETPIQPLMLGDVGRTLNVAEALRQSGIFVTPIRPPTVPEGSARLRITLSAAHQPQHVDRLMTALADALK